MKNVPIVQEPQKILIIKPSAMGDIIHSLPFLDSVKHRFPDAAVHWVVAKSFRELLDGHPMIDKLWVIDKDRWKKPGEARATWTALRELFRTLRCERFDVAVDLQGLLRSGVIAWASGARIRLGFAEAREGSPFFYTHKIQGGRDIHAVDRYLTIARAIGCSVTEPRFPFPPLPKIVPAMENVPQPYWVMVPSAGKEANRWPAERFGELASRLPWTSVIVGSPADAVLAQSAEAASKGRAISVAGKTRIPELIALIQNARFLVSNDTGPMHIAAALKVPVFAIFGPANPVRTGPYGSMHTIIKEETACAPCYRKKKCSHWSCLEALTVEKVLGVIMEKIEAGAHGESFRHHHHQK